jgi:N,N'-diacetyllegionaminate synthase
MKNNLIERIVEAKYPFLIAEIGINHNGDINLAKEMIIAAKENGANCVKFQSFIADNYISEFATKANYQQSNKKVSEKSQKDIIKDCELSIEQILTLKEYSEKNKIEFLSTPFEIMSFNSLEKMGVPAVKISSCNLTNIPFLKEVAESKLPVLLSTGMGSLSEVITAVTIFKNSGNPILLFQCTSNYPSNINNANVRVLETYKNLFDIPVGFSDHTKNNLAAIVAVALGAVAVEKHFTLSKNLPGIDQKASIEPTELKNLAEDLKMAKLALGDPLKRRTDEEEDTAVALRRSIVANRDINAGESLTIDMVTMKRPGNGIPPYLLSNLIGAKLRHFVKCDSVLALDDFLSK